MKKFSLARLAATLVVPLALGSAPATAEPVQVAKQQSSFDRGTVVVIFAGQAQQHRLTLDAYRLLVAQGVPVSIVPAAAPRLAPATPNIVRAEAIRTRAPVWTTGVYR